MTIATKLVAARETNDYSIPPGGYHTGQNVIGTSTSHAPIYSNPVLNRQPSGMPPLPTTLHPPAATTPPPTTLPAPAAPPANALSPSAALNNFANSAGMKFAMEQMANGVNNLYAAHGALQSGAAAKAIQDRAGQMAIQDYFLPYTGLLQGQQNMGAQAGGAIAGVGSSFGNSVAGINGNMANAIGQGALNIGNANANQAAINGQANAGLGSAIGSGLGSIGSSFFQPHY